MALHKAYRVSRLAQADIESIYAYTVKTWSGEQADIYYAMIIESFEGLVSGAKIGHTAAIDDYLALPIGSHSIFYRLDGNTVFIARVLHQVMDVERHLGPFSESGQKL
jgi:toxin ParE1/3/4